MKKQIIFSLLMALFFLSGEAFAENGIMNGNPSPMQRISNMETQYMSTQHQMNGGGMMMNNQACDSAQQMSVMIKMMTNPNMIKMMSQMKGLNATARNQMLNKHMKMVQALINSNKKITCSKSQQTRMMGMVTNPMMINMMSKMEGKTTNGRMMMMRNNASMMMRMMNGSQGMHSGSQSMGTMGNMDGMNMGNSSMNQKVASNTHMSDKNSIVRKGIINVEALDKNHDGKLYEDVMDFNVISDKPGVCPICGMKLHEMTIQQVKENLKEHGFKYK